MDLVKYVKVEQKDNTDQEKCRVEAYYKQKKIDMVKPEAIFDKEALLEEYFEKRTVDRGNFSDTYVVSPDPPTATDLSFMHEKISLMLESRAAREKPLCPIRRDVLRGTSMELLRQLVIFNPAQAALFKRLLDHYQSEFEAYEYLLHSTDAYTGRAVISKMHYELDRQATIDRLSKETEVLESQRDYLNSRCKQMESNLSDDHILTEQYHKDEIKFFTRTSEHLKALIEGIPYW